MTQLSIVPWQKASILNAPHSVTVDLGLLTKEVTMARHHYHIITMAPFDKHEAVFCHTVD